MLFEHQKITQNSFIGYVGGKSVLRSTIISCIHPHSCYVEMFCGSATVWFGKPPEMSKTEIINDKHGELINLMRVMSGSYFNEDIRQEFISYIRSMPSARSVFQEWQHLEKDKLALLNPAQRAFIFYYCTKNGFSSIPTAGFAASPFALNRYNMNTDFEPFIERFRARNVQIENMDFRDLVVKYSKPRANVFFYIDPPYYVANDTNYYKHVFNEQDHKDLRQCCDVLHNNGNKFIVSYDDVQEVIDLYSGFYIYRTDPIVYKSMQMEEQSETIKAELLITNYDVFEMLRKKISKRSKHFDIGDENIEIGNQKIEFAGCCGLTKLA